jgi:hypothetical protein
MILEMKVPSPGESIKEVEIATWLVKDGDYVEKDQAIAEVDSDKATLRIASRSKWNYYIKSRRRRCSCRRCCSLFNRYCAYAAKQQEVVLQLKKPSKSSKS